MLADDCAQDSFKRVHESLDKRTIASRFYA